MSSWGTRLARCSCDALRTITQTKSSAWYLSDQRTRTLASFLLQTTSGSEYREQPGSIGADFHELHLARQANPTPLGDRPLIVVVGTRPDPKVSTPEDIAREKAAELEEQPRISRNSKLVRDPSSGHHTHVDNPKLVANAIEEAVTAAMKGRSSLALWKSGEGSVA